MRYTILILLFFQGYTGSLATKCSCNCSFANNTKGNQNQTQYTQGPDLSKQQCDLGPVKICVASRYRSLDGTCNNLERPAWGATNTPYTRMLPNDYADGKDPLVCCKNGRYTPAATTNSLCAAIRIFPNDPYQSPFGNQCYDFQRTDTTRLHGCSAPNAPAEQLNSITAFLDASLVYGVSDDQAISLREMKGGRLNTTIRNGKVWPPQAENASATCVVDMPNEPCYVAGDIRVNQNSHISTLQVIFLREHNRIADTLAKINPKWNDETIYQETRRIVIAELQHIHYYEYLPLQIGYVNMVKEKLIYPGATGYINDYDPKVNPTIINEYATAAFRHPHNELRGMLEILEENRISSRDIRISDWFNRPLVIEIGDNLNGLARGFTEEKAGYSDQYWDLEFTQYLFRGKRVVGDDLAATDIQRGRDHGLGSYIQARAACKLSVPVTFKDMIGDISAENVEKLQSVYDCPADVDLRVGGGLERSVSGTKAGPTFLCIMIEQLRRMRTGDRYFYENGSDPKTRLTLSQLESIRTGASAARLLCDNSGSIKSMQRKALVRVSLTNLLVPCYLLPAVDLQLWKET